MVAGMEVDLSVVRKQGRIAILIAVTRIIVAFGLSFGVGLLIHNAFSPTSPKMAFAAFFGIACTVCAVPVLAKILHELGMLKSDIGLLSLSSSTLTDFICWIFFTIVAGVAIGKGVELHGAIITILSIFILMVFLFTVGKAAVNRITKLVQDESVWQSGTVMVFSFLLAIGLAIVFQKIGVHAVFGFFMAGILIGESPYITNKTRESISTFVMSLFSPLFFASIGIKVNFWANLDPALTAIVLGVVVVGKTAGVILGARISGMNLRDALPVASGMLAGGAMEIIISLLGLQMKLINEDLFVSLVITAVLTSMAAGPMLVWSLRLKKFPDLGSILPKGAVVSDLSAWTIREAVSQLVLTLADHLKPCNSTEVIHSILAREAIGSTAIGNQIAVPHARLEGLREPLLAAARIESGIHMDSPDGQDVHLIFLILTPATDMGLQVQILAGIAETVHEPHLREKLLTCPDYEFERLLRESLKQKKITTAATGGISP
jgi:Kef-type K+ transport system membrane component KefB